MLQKLRRFGTETKGVAAIEFALIVPFIILVYLGMFDLTSLITVNRKVTYSASVMADLVTQNDTSVMRSQLNDYYNSVTMVMDPVPDADVRVEVYGFRLAGSTVNQIWSDNNGQGTACGGAPSTTGLNALMSGGNDVVIARVCTDFAPFVATFLGDYILGAPSFTISQQIAERPRKVGAAQLTCYRTSVGGAVC